MLAETVLNSSQVAFHQDQVPIVLHALKSESKDVVLLSFYMPQVFNNVEQFFIMGIASAVL